MKKAIVKGLMSAFPAFPDENDLSLWEVFRQRRYADGSDKDRRALEHASAQFRYDCEKRECFFDQYFPDISPTEFLGKSILDLGCFTGGRLVSWVERYGFAGACGIDINPIFERAGSEFAASKGVDAAFNTGFAEALPYGAVSFDFVVSYDVFEHVRDVSKTLEECHRVLKPGGRLLCVFPQFFQPLESHLGLATKMPALHWFFSGEVIAAAYYETIMNRGQSAYWYMPPSPVLDDWERLPSLNGITVRKFRHIVNSQPDWRLLSWNPAPILSDGTRAKLPAFRLIRSIFVLPARIPILEELFLGRICCVLQKNY